MDITRDIRKAIQDSNIELAITVYEQEIEDMELWIEHYQRMIEILERSYQNAETTESE